MEKHSLGIIEEFSAKFPHAFESETPFFVFSKDRIVNNLRSFEKCFPGASIHYAMKANAEKEVLETVLSAGGSFEVASRYELDMLKAINTPPENIIYGTSVKSIAHIKEFYEYGVDRFSCDSISELEKIALAAPGARVYIRISVNDTGSVFKFSEKFGTEKTNVVPLLKRAKELGLQTYGVSFNVGSQASNVKAWAEALASIQDVLEDLVRNDIQIEILDIGGGYPCNTYSSSTELLPLEEIASYFYEQLETLSFKPKLILEPGRAIIANAGVMVGSVIGRVERKEQTWLFLDIGVYNGLFETMAYQGSTRYRISSKRHSIDGEMSYALAGPTGDSPDVITREALLPRDIGVGDKILVHDVGAYSLVATCLFNGFPKPPVFYY